MKRKRIQYFWMNNPLQQLREKLSWPNLPQINQILAPDLIDSEDWQKIPYATGFLLSIWFVTGWLATDLILISQCLPGTSTHLREFHPGVAMRRWFPRVYKPSLWWSTGGNIDHSPGSLCWNTRSTPALPLKQDFRNFNEYPLQQNKQNLKLLSQVHLRAVCLLRSRRRTFLLFAAKNISGLQVCSKSFTGVTQTLFNASNVIGYLNVRYPLMLS